MLALILAPNSSAPTGLKLYACLAVGRLVEGNKIDPNVVNTIVAGVCLLSAETNDDTAHIVLEALAALINVIFYLLVFINSFSSPNQRLFMEQRKM